MNLLLTILFLETVSSRGITRQGLDYNYDNWENETTPNLSIEENRLNVTKTYNLTTNVSTDPILVEIINIKDEIGGFMSAGIVVLLRSIVVAEELTVMMIMQSLCREVHKAEEDGRLEALGDYLIQSVITLTEMLKRSENEAQAQALYCLKAVAEKESLLPDSKKVLEIGNTLYSETDMLSLVPIVRAIQNYPKEGHGKVIAANFTEMVTRKLHSIKDSHLGDQFFNELRHVINRKYPRPEFRRGVGATKKLVHRNGFDYEYENWEKDWTPDYLIPGMNTTQTIPANWTISSVGAMREEIKSICDEAQSGLFTASLMVLLQTYSTLDDELATSAFHRALEAQLTLYNSRKAFDIFGPLMNNAIYAFIVKLSDAETESTKKAAKDIWSVLKTRDVSVLQDLNAILNTADSIFNNQDVDHVIDVIRNILLFPASKKTHYEIADEAIKAFMFRPYERIKGSETEKYLLKLVTKSLKKRFGMSSTDAFPLHTPVGVPTLETLYTERS